MCVRMQIAQLWETYQKKLIYVMGCVKKINIG